MSNPTINIVQDNDEFEVTVTIDEELAGDTKCLVVVCVTYAYFVVYDGFERVSKWANGRTSLVFKNLNIDSPGEYMFCASVTRTDGEPLLAYSNVFTVKNQV